MESNVINLRPPATAVEVTPAQITQGGYGPHRIRLKDGSRTVVGWFPTDAPASKGACERLVASWTAQGWVPPGWSAEVVPVSEGELSLFDASPELVRS